jgi:hypothetical protein
LLIQSGSCGRLAEAKAKASNFSLLAGFIAHRKSQMVDGLYGEIHLHGPLAV